MASVKPSQSTGETNFIRLNAGGRFVADGVTVSVLVQQAYDVLDLQVVGAPGWVDRERFDIQAIAPSLASVKQDVLLQRQWAELHDAVGRPFSFLGGQVVGNVQRIVVDKTGLTGLFEFNYTWTNDLPAAGAGDGRVSFMTALEEQLG